MTASPGTISAKYWAGAAEGRLILQKCASCGLIRHYPRVLCSRCWSFSVEPVQASGRGAIHSWTVAHHAFAPEWTTALPYVLATVDLPEGVRVLGRLIGDRAPAVGLEVEFGFDAAPGGSPVIVCTPVGTSRASQ
jgi:hypothetical protein